VCVRARKCVCVRARRLYIESLRSCRLGGN